jgi:NAD(P)-dependent dehydrogenase (short-subunit alcohol dehydrogenase family)
VLDLPPAAPLEDCVARLRELHEEYREDYRAYYERTRRPDSPAMRGADPPIVLVPGVGMFSFGKDKQTARVAGEFYVNAINVMRGAEAISTYAPIDEAEKFRIEYWALEEAKLQRMPKPEAARHAASRSSPAPRSASARPSPAARRRGRVRRRRRPRPAQGPGAAAEIGTSDVAIGVQADVTDAAQVEARWRRRARVRRRRPRGQQRRAVDLQAAARHHRRRLGPAARRDGQGLVPRLPGRSRVMIEQGMGGDIVYISSKNSVFAGPNNIAYSATKADQAHQVRLLAAELGEHGIKVNGINPDGVVRGSASSPAAGAPTVPVYGVPEDELGAFYAQRTLLKREVLPEHVANAVFGSPGEDHDRAPHDRAFLHIPVDAGVAAAFLR